MCACNYFSRVSSRKGGSLLIKREGLVVNRLNRRTTLERLLGGTDFFTDLMHRSFSKSRRLYILPDLNPPRISSDAPTRLSPRKAYSRLFVSSHRVLTLRDGRCRGDNISTIGWYMPRRSEWLCRRKTCLIKYRAICHGSLWCDRERIILWISSSATCSPSAPPSLSSSLPTSFSPPPPPSRSWERIIPDPLLSPNPPRIVPPTCSSLVSFRRSRILRITPPPFFSPFKFRRARDLERLLLPRVAKTSRERFYFDFTPSDILIGKIVFPSNLAPFPFERVSIFPHRRDFTIRNPLQQPSP